MAGIITSSMSPGAATRAFTSTVCRRDQMPQRITGMCGERDPSGKTEGAVKFDVGKAPIARGFLNYFPRAIEAVATVSQAGYEKYKKWAGWRDVEDAEVRYRDALARHLLSDDVYDNGP